MGTRTWRQTAVHPSRQAGGKRAHRELQRSTARRVFESACVRQPRRRTHARKRIEAWRTDYNSVRPHSALGQLAPDQFRQLHQQKNGEPTNLRMVYSAG
ncbi:integrase core domain-containing protein [Burkholderia aenigmatica]|uniref:integrase core domain-containing protein n=1 Tax=Burkholderia TaxID=32008 RepID=UPI0034A08315